MFLSSTLRDGISGLGDAVCSDATAAILWCMHVGRISFSCLLHAIFHFSYWRATHAQAGHESWGVDGDTGSIVDMKKLGVWDPLTVKLQTVKSAIEVRTFFACNL